MNNQYNQYNYYPQGPQPPFYNPNHANFNNNMNNGYYNQQNPYPQTQFYNNNQRNYQNQGNFQQKASNFNNFHNSNNNFNGFNQFHNQNNKNNGLYQKNRPFGNRKFERKAEEKCENKENKEEIKLWVERRKKNYPGQKNEEKKAFELKIKEEGGEITNPKLSQLETKLRKKIKILNSQCDRKSRIKEKYWNDLKYFMYDKGNNANNNSRKKLIK